MELWRVKKENERTLAFVDGFWSVRTDFVGRISFTLPGRWKQRCVSHSRGCLCLRLLHWLFSLS